MKLTATREDLLAPCKVSSVWWSAGRRMPVLANVLCSPRATTA